MLWVQVLQPTGDNTTPTGDNTTTAAAATTRTTVDAEASTPSLNTCKANLSLRFQTATTESVSSTEHDPDARAVVMTFPLMNRKTETANSGVYYVRQSEDPH